MLAVYTTEAVIVRFERILIFYALEGLSVWAWTPNEHLGAGGVRMGEWAAVVSFRGLISGIAGC